MSTEAGPKPPAPIADFGLGLLTDRWQAAFDAAEAALRAATSDLPLDEVGRRRHDLAVEETATLRLLQGFAREHYVAPLPHLFLGPVSPPMLGLPSALRACVFELDGVLANSAAMHRAAWAETFDGFLLRRSAPAGREVALFDPRRDYEQHIDGRPRVEGVLGFLGSRGIGLDMGQPDDPPDRETVHGLANRKNAALQEHLTRQGVNAFTGSRRYLAAARRAGLRRAVVSVSANTAAMLELSDLASLLDTSVDGQLIRRERLRVLPEPDTLLAATRRLGAEPDHTAVFVHSLAGVQAARAGGFVFVVGIDQSGQAAVLVEHGADRVVPDLTALMGRSLAG